MSKTFLAGIRLRRTIRRQRTQYDGIGHFRKGQSLPGSGDRRFGADVAEWLERAMLGPDGRERMPKKRLAAAAEISPDTLYRLLRGEGHSVEEDTLRKLAAALEVPQPIIVRNIVAVPPEAPNARALVSEAQALLQRALLMMGGEATPTDPVLARAEALVAEEERLTGRGTPGARGRGKRAG